MPVHQLAGSTRRSPWIAGTVRSGSGVLCGLPIKFLQEDSEKEKKDKEALALKELHWMKCPKCGNDMKVIQINNIELEKCKNCEGIYFDAGELDDLLLRESDKRKSFFHKLFTLEKKLFKKK